MNSYGPIENSESDPPIFLSKDNVTLKEEISIYKFLIEKFKEKNIIIKPHPRDPKNYNKIFPKIKIIDKYFPIELLNLISIEPDITCSVVSTSLLNFKKSKIYVYDGELKNETFITAHNDLIKLKKKIWKLSNR